MSLRSELANTAQQAANNANRINPAIHHLLDELAILDGYPTTTTGAANQGPRGQRCITVQLEDDDGDVYAIEQVPVTAVEDVALKRAAITDLLEDIYAHTHGSTVIQNDLARLLTDALRTRIATTPPPKPCDATGREGYMIPRDNGGWSDLACTNIPARGPLCIPCYHRERRWRIDHNLPTREDAVA